MGLDQTLLKKIKMEFLKSAYVPPPPFNQNISQEMMMQAQQIGGMPQGGMPMDPSMMGGMPQGGMPMDPSMMGGMPQGGMPMDPSMMGGMPMDPSMMGGMPQGGGMEMSPEMLQQMMSEVPKEEQVSEPEKSEPEDSKNGQSANYGELERRLSTLEGKIDALISVISGEKQSSEKNSPLYKAMMELLKK